MIRIVETKVASRLGQLFGCKTLERGLGCDRHEHGEQYGAMGQRQIGSAGFRGLIRQIFSDSQQLMKNSKFSVRTISFQGRDS